MGPSLRVILNPEFVSDVMEWLLTGLLWYNFGRGSSEMSGHYFLFFFLVEREQENNLHVFFFATHVRKLCCVTGGRSSGVTHFFFFFFPKHLWFIIQYVGAIYVTPGSPIQSPHCTASGLSMSALITIQFNSIQFNSIHLLSRHSCCSIAARRTKPHKSTLKTFPSQFKFLDGCKCRRCVKVKWCNTVPVLYGSRHTTRSARKRCCDHRFG